MIIEPLEDAASSILPGHRRKSCRVAYELAGTEPDIVWFDVPEEVADGVGAGGNAWLICFLPLAVTLKVKLVIRGAVDPVLLQDAGELMRVWSKWHPGLDVVEIEASLQPRHLNKPSPRVGCFFSGGVDSFFTVLHQGSEVSRYEQAGERAIDDLVLVWGFDLPLDRSDEFTKLRVSLHRRGGIGQTVSGGRDQSPGNPTSKACLGKTFPRLRPGRGRASAERLFFNIYCILQPRLRRSFSLGF